MFKKLLRVFRRMRWQIEFEKSLNRRAEVENELIEMANGKKPLPDKVKCRVLADKLGVPPNWKGAA